MKEVHLSLFLAIGGPEPLYKRNGRASFGFAEIYCIICFSLHCHLLTDGCPRWGHFLCLPNLWVLSCVAISCLFPATVLQMVWWVCHGSSAYTKNCLHFVTLYWKECFSGFPWFFLCSFQICILVGSSGSKQRCFLVRFADKNFNGSRRAALAQWGCGGRETPATIQGVFARGSSLFEPSRGRSLQCPRQSCFYTFERRRE